MCAIDTTDDAAFVIALIDTMIPGDGDFPSASEAGVAALVAARAKEMQGPAFLAGLREALDRDGAPFAGADEGERVARLVAHETAKPSDVQAVCVVLYLSYYGAASVKAAIRRMGMQYPDAPQPGGYVMSPFDPADPMEAPVHRRGHFVATDAVARVSTEGLGDLMERVG
ncbi:gluconate 2-dehydrogenase subunit 3 family protein [Kaistia granuli]|uniref:gluconate 2-dehydrogenase subunit 3 family protein n=1 Tax=Kaistia granuli TaxID=363259 RepID=UPI0003618C28|nr:gluconate 2-dehydrogenase subunit 3 family protein [Kaistia granuli]